MERRNTRRRRLAKEKVSRLISRPKTMCCRGKKRRQAYQRSKGQNNLGANDPIGTTCPGGVPAFGLDILGKSRLNKGSKGSVADNQKEEGTHGFG